LTLAYDGTAFAGWQHQASARTVQATLEEALLPYDGHRVVVTASGRTDAGAHAAGQVVSFSLQSTIAVDRLQRGLNATLPSDVRVVQAEEVAESFNARFDARGKTYRYWIWAGGVAPPFVQRYVWHLPTTLDVEAMGTGAAMLVGTHDFAAFQASGSDAQTTRREVRDSNVACIEAANAAFGGLCVLPRAVTTGALVRYEITGNGFLRHMVRNIVGTLVDIGRGHRTPESMRDILLSRSRSQAGPTAPPAGLVLWSVHY
jgi:tRNA pseudouridine38-40 synthase